MRVQGGPGTRLPAPLGFAPALLRAVQLLLNVVRVVLWVQHELHLPVVSLQRLDAGVSELAQRAGTAGWVDGNPPRTTGRLTCFLVASSTTRTVLASERMRPGSGRQTARDATPGSAREGSE